MSDNVYAHDSGVATDLFAAGDGNLFQRVMQMRAAGDGRDTQSEASTVLSSSEGPMSLFKTVRPNIVQSIRAFRVQDLLTKPASLASTFCMRIARMHNRNRKSSKRLRLHFCFRNISEKITTPSTIA